MIFVLVTMDHMTLCVFFDSPALEAHLSDEDDAENELRGILGTRQQGGK